MMEARAVRPTKPVIPAEAGIQCVRFRGLQGSEALDSRLRGNDD
jgi:hypothetical protein